MNERVLQVLIADDEEIARKRLARLVKLLPDTAVCGECRDGEQVLERVRAGGVDVILLDVRMPGLSGMEALELLPAGGPYVIFCTAHSEHAVRAFDVGAVDYLLKPIEAARLAKALERARSRDAVKRFHAEVRAQRDRGRPRPELARLAVPTRDGIVLIDPEVISHAVLDGELVTVYTAHGKYLTDFALQDLHDKLPAGKFERVHRRALLNLEAVARLAPNGVGGFTAHTHRGDTVEVSRAAARQLRRKLGLRRPGPGDDDAGDPDPD